MGLREDAIKLGERFLVPIEDLHPGVQVRDSPKMEKVSPKNDEMKIIDLAGSMHREGQLEDLEIRPVGEGYEIVNGERRFRAAEYANAKLGGGPDGKPILALWCYKEPKGVTEDVRIFRQIEHNTGHPLTDLEKAKAFHKLHTLHKYSKAELAAASGLSSQQVGFLMRLVDAPAELQNQVSEGKVSATTAIRATKAGKGEDLKDRVAAGEKVKGKDLSPLKTLSKEESDKAIEKVQKAAQDFKAGSGDRLRLGGVVFGLTVGRLARNAEEGKSLAAGARGMKMAIDSATSQDLWDGIVQGIEVGAGFRPLDFV